jgi:hypothetical protein
VQILTRLATALRAAKFAGCTASRATQMRGREGDRHTAKDRFEGSQRCIRLRLRRVSLRESTAEGADPIARLAASASAPGP